MGGRHVLQRNDLKEYEKINPGTKNSLKLKKETAIFVDNPNHNFLPSKDEMQCSQKKKQNVHIAIVALCQIKSKILKNSQEHKKLGIDFLSPLSM